MNIHQLRKLVGREEIDYQLLLSALSNYARPRDKITSWLKSGELIRIKKGFYVFGKDAAITPYSKEVIANLIYGPSAISLIYALSFYGITPEKVTTITSITHKRDKSFTTPIGDFSYRYLTTKKYAIGININRSNKTSPFLIASPEKALCDHVHLTDKKIRIFTTQEAEHYLLQDLRLSEEHLQKFDISHLEEITSYYQDKRLETLTKFIQEMQKNA